MTATVRIWRLRKRQQSIDAVLRKDGAGGPSTGSGSPRAKSRGGVTLDFVLNGRRIAGRRWPTRAQAMKAATEKREELERAGWATHW